MINYTPEEIREFADLSDGYLSDLLHNLRSKSFSHQEKLQADGVIMERVKFKINDFSKRLRKTGSSVHTKYDYSFWVDYPFINPSRKMALKRAKIIGQEVNFYDISDRRDLFDKNFMAFVDGKLVDFITVLVRTDGIEFICNVNENTINHNGLPYGDFKTFRSADSDIDVVFFANNAISPVNPDRKTIVANKGDIKFASPGFIESLSSDQTYLSFIQRQANGVAVELHHATNKERLVKFYEAYNRTTPNKRGFINVFGFKNLSEIIDVDFDEEIIQIPGYAMPVPSENILVFKVSDDGEYSYTSEVKIARKFPNFYEIDNPTGEDLALLVFFSDVNSTNSGFYNAIKNYYKYNGDNLEGYINAPEEIKNFIPGNVNFSIKEFDQASGINDPLYYKLSKLEELALKDPEYLREFLKDRHVNGDGFYVDMAKIDLTTRIRKNTLSEARLNTVTTDFAEDHYVLTFKELTEHGKYRVTMFVDGHHFNATHIFDVGIYTYVYIPARLVKPDSIVEVERSRVKAMSYHNHKFDGVEPLRLRLEPCTLAPADFDFLDAKTGESIDRSNFTFTSGTFVYNRDINEIIRQNIINIDCVDGTHLNKDIRIVYGRGFDSNTIDAPSDGIGHVFEIHGQGYIERGKIRSFHNGKKLPTYSVNIQNGVDVDTVKVSLLAEHKAGDELTLEYGPNDRRIILDTRTVPEDGVLNFFGHIDKPFDLAWYDVYVNGRKLNRSNIDYITPYIIRLKNLDSNRNLTVYEVVRPAEIISLVNGSKTLIDELWDKKTEFYESVMKVDNDIEDVEEDILVENISWYTEKMKDLISEVSLLDGMKEDPTGTKYFHIQPDIEQIKPDLVYKYDHIVEDGVVKIDPDNHPEELDEVIINKIGG